MTNNNVPEFNRELLQEYLKMLVEKYDTLQLDPFSNKARLAVRREIEDIKAVLAEKEMEKCWANLDAVFGMGNVKPEPKYGSPQYYADEILERESDSKFKKGKSLDEVF